MRKEEFVVELVENKTTYDVKSKVTDANFCVEVLNNETSGHSGVTIYDEHGNLVSDKDELFDVLLDAIKQAQRIEVEIK